MKTVYLILAIICYIAGVIIGYAQKVRGDQSKVSMREANYPVLTSLNPLAQPVFTLIPMLVFIWLYGKSE